MSEGLWEELMQERNVPLIVVLVDELLDFCWGNKVSWPKYIKGPPWRFGNPWFSSDVNIGPITYVPESMFYNVFNS